MSLLRPLLHWFANRLDVVGITGPAEDPNLCRYFVGEVTTGRSHVRLYLQRILRSDPAYVFHNHPWAYAVSLILVGGYREERFAGPYTGSRPALRVFRPGSVNRFGPGLLHRLDLLEDECWTVLLTGPVVQPWRFWSALTGTWVSWRRWFREQGMPASWQAAPVGRMA